MKTSIRNLLPLTLLAAWFSCQVLTAQTVPGDGTATLSNITGNVIVLDANGNPVNRTTLLPGDRVVTTDGGSAVINFSNGGYLMLDQDSILDIDRLDSTDIELSLVKGDFYADMPGTGDKSYPGDTSTTEFSITTSNGIVKAQGTPFYVSHRAKTRGGSDFETKAIGVNGSDGRRANLKVVSTDGTTTMLNETQGVGTVIQPNGTDQYVVSQAMVTEITDLISRVVPESSNPNSPFNSALVATTEFANSEPVRNLPFTLPGETTTENQFPSSTPDSSLIEVSGSQDSQSPFSSI